MKIKLLIGIIAIFLISLVGAVNIDTTTIMNTSVSNSSITFSVSITSDNIIIESTSINITNATYTTDVLRSCDIYWDTINSNLDSADFGCAPAGDIIPPTFDNLRDFSHYVNTSFSESITASDVSGIDSYWLNDTTYFSIDAAGLITNVTNLSRIEIHWLNISVNDTFNNQNSGIFYIDIIIVPSAGNVTITSVQVCRYKKLGYYNTKLVWLRQTGCI